MEELTLQRIPFTKDADNKLKALKARTGVTPNLLCRVGFCMSLDMPSEPPSIEGKERGREINRFTLLGEYEKAFLALLVVWKKEQKSKLHFDELFSRHMNRGAMLLTTIVK